MRSYIFISLLCSTLMAQESKLSVLPIKQEQLEEIISHRNGNVLFLNVWATWCTPCVEEFPDIVKLADEYQRKNTAVEFIAVSADYPDEIDSLILPFLKKFPNISFKVFVADFNSMDEFISSIDQEWTGAVPATFLFSSEGKRTNLMIGQHSYDQFKTEIEKILHSSK